MNECRNNQSTVQLLTEPTNNTGELMTLKENEIYIEINDHHQHGDNNLGKKSVGLTSCSGPNNGSLGNI